MTTAGAAAQATSSAACHPAQSSARASLRGLPSQRQAADGAGHPLLLSDDMQGRLRNAVRALLALPELRMPSASRVARECRETGATDTERFALLLLAARTLHPSHPKAVGESGEAVPEAGRAVMSAREQGRWLGLQVRAVRGVHRELRARGLLETQRMQGEYGLDGDNRCTVLPLYRALRRAEGYRPELALSRKELAVLRRLLEYVCSPGWTHRDGSVTPPGLLAGHTGQGAATDRLAMLLMVLSSRRDGSVRLCSAPVGEEGRPAATVARMLGCRPAGGAAVLARLSQSGVSSQRRKTVLNHRSRLTILDLAAYAHGRPAPMRRGKARLAAAPAPPPSPVQGGGLPRGRGSRGSVAAGGSLPPVADEIVWSEGEEVPEGEGSASGVEEAGLAAWDAEMAEIWAEVLRQDAPERCIEAPEAFEEQADWFVPAGACGPGEQTAAAEDTAVQSQLTVLEGCAQNTNASLADLDATAPQEHPSPWQGNVQFSNVKPQEWPKNADLDATAPPHAPHPPLVPVRSPGTAFVVGFSGGTPSGNAPLPERAYEPENIPAARTPLTAADVTAPGRAAGPLRGEQPNSPALHQPNSPQQDPTPALRSPVGKAWAHASLRAVPSPPTDVQQPLEPVWGLWQRIERSGARARIITATRRALSEIPTTATGGPGHALAGRLLRRLDEQGGPHLVTDPVGWLLGRGLPQRPGCHDVRCDDGLRLDTQDPCESCNDRRGRSRGVRAVIAAHLDTEMPDATDTQRQAALEQRLQEHTRTEAEREIAQRHRREEAAARKVAARQHLHSQLQDAERTRQAQPCTDCGRADAAGLCGQCADHRGTEHSIREAVEAAVASRADLTDGDDIAAVTAAVEDNIRTEVHTSRRQALEDGATDQTLAVMTRLTAETAATEYRNSALALLARTQSAQAEGRQIYQAEMRSAHRHHRAEAHAAATAAAQEAVAQTARLMLSTRRQQLSTHTPHTSEPEAGEYNYAHIAGAARLKEAFNAARQRSARSH